jgi:hypothetical protein
MLRHFGRQSGKREGAIAVLREKHTYIVGVRSDDIVKLANIARGKGCFEGQKDSAKASSRRGCGRFGVAASASARRGTVWLVSPTAGAPCPGRPSVARTPPRRQSPKVGARRVNRARPGSERGAPGNRRPYRN